MSDTATPQGHVILLHGLFMSDLVMLPLAKRLQQAGWIVSRVNYPSTRIDTERLFGEIAALARLHPELPVHFVGHSLGGILIRLFMDTHPQTSEGYVVTLGTPHQPSSIAKWLHDNHLGFLLGNSRQHGLLQGFDACTWHHPQPLGNIAGSLPLGPRPLLLPDADQGPSDGTVLIEETHLPGEHDHIVLNASHTTLIYLEEPFRQLQHFLTQGQFDHPPV